MGCFSCFGSGKQDRKPLKKDDNSTPERGELAASVAPAITKQPSGAF